MCVRHEHTRSFEENKKYFYFNVCVEMEIRVVFFLFNISLCFTLWYFFRTWAPVHVRVICNAWRDSIWWHHKKSTCYKNGVRVCLCWVAGFDTSVNDSALWWSSCKHKSHNFQCKHKHIHVSRKHLFPASNAENGFVGVQRICRIAVNAMAITLR